MALSNRDRIGKALDLLRDGLGPYVQREIEAALRRRALPLEQVRRCAGDSRQLNKAMSSWDAAALLKLVWESWNQVFRNTLGPAERSLVNEMRGHRNQWAHQGAFPTDDAYRALDSAYRLLTSVSATQQAAEVDRMKSQLLRARYEQQRRAEGRRRAGTTIEGALPGGLRPWREVITPHADVQKGRYQQAEFAADLWQVHLGEGTDEYRDPDEFFRRTYLTQSLTELLVRGAQRLTTGGGDPVVQLQTNFGGGKTHSLLALYHLFSGKDPLRLTGMEKILRLAGVSELPSVRRVVFVGNKVSPGSPERKPDGTRVRTLWGELAWQLGGAAAFEQIREDDEKATNPGDKLRKLFNEYGPCLVLIDEWVAYARQLHEDRDIPGGDFETQFTFAQALTESAKLADRCLLVISLPASDTGTSSPSADDEEVGGQRGRQALNRLRNVVGRVGAPWRPASAEEGFEIVRRRLFETTSETAQYKERDLVARAFGDLYRKHRAQFPRECRGTDYESRIRDSYPIHPEIFDRLYSDWSTLARFQRTRGVLRLMASVIYNLWEEGDRNPLILPAHVAIGDENVQSELTRYLPDSWTPVLNSDVEGADALPGRIDRRVTNLGKYSATKRVARTLYLGSAPGAGTSHRGLDDQRITLGCALPGEPPPVYGDALRRLSAEATYLYQDGGRYWYDTRPTVAKLAKERAERLSRDTHAVEAELKRRLTAELRTTGAFGRIHILPGGSEDVPDDVVSRLVVLGPKQCYERGDGGAGLSEAKRILEWRGSAPRVYRNTLVFLAPDETRFQDLDEALRFHLAWRSIVDERDSLELLPSQARSAEAQVETTSGRINTRLRDAYPWLLAPAQSSPTDDVDWTPVRLRGAGALAERASNRLSRDDRLVARIAPSQLRMEADRTPLWRGNHVPVDQLIEDYARYLYLTRVVDSNVILEAVQDGVADMAWQTYGFAHADSFDEDSEEYRGLSTGKRIELQGRGPQLGLLVKPEAVPRAENGGGTTGGETETDNGSDTLPAEVKFTRFYGSVVLDSGRVGTSAGTIGEEIVSHLLGQQDAKVEVTLEVNARLPKGASERLRRIVTENGASLHFRAMGFEKD